MPVPSGHDRITAARTAAVRGLAALLLMLTAGLAGACSARTAAETTLARLTAEAWAEREDTTRALLILDRALTAYPNDPALLAGRATVHLRAFQWAQARADAEAALALDPTDADTHYLLGLILASAPDGAAARSAAIEAFAAARGLGLSPEQDARAARYIAQLATALTAAPPGG